MLFGSRQPSTIAVARSSVLPAILGADTCEWDYVGSSVILAEEFDGYTLGGITIHDELGKSLRPISKR
jgi:hypothetical protein